MVEEEVVVSVVVEEEAVVLASTWRGERWAAEGWGEMERREVDGDRVKRACLFWVRLDLCGMNTDPRTGRRTVWVF